MGWIHIPSECERPLQWLSGWVDGWGHLGQATSDGVFRQLQLLMPRCRTDDNSEEIQARLFQVTFNHQP